MKCCDWSVMSAIRTALEVMECRTHICIVGWVSVFGCQQTISWPQWRQNALPQNVLTVTLQFFLYYCLLCFSLVFQRFLFVFFLSENATCFDCDERNWKEPKLLWPLWAWVLKGFSWCSDDKESAHNGRDLGSIPGSGRSPRGENGNPL